jgi:hypothetical protein
MNSMSHRLFHFSDDPNIGHFEPRPVSVPSQREPGSDWLNGALVWAVSEERQATYLFPRDCPRIVLWLTDATSAEDRAEWWGDRTCSAIAHVEWRWLDRLLSEQLFRYELPSHAFEPLEGDWMWIARETVVPIDVKPCGNLLHALERDGVELHLMDSLAPLCRVWDTTLHASGIRLRNAVGW